MECSSRARRQLESFIERATPNGLHSGRAKSIRKVVLELRVVYEREQVFTNNSRGQSAKPFLRANAAEDLPRQQDVEVLIKDLYLAQDESAEGSHAWDALRGRKKTGSRAQGADEFYGRLVGDIGDEKAVKLLAVLVLSDPPPRAVQCFVRQIMQNANVGPAQRFSDHLLRFDNCSKIKIWFAGELKDQGVINMVNRIYADTQHIVCPFIVGGETDVPDNITWPYRTERALPGHVEHDLGIVAVKIEPTYTKDPVTTGEEIIRKDVTHGYFNEFEVNEWLKKQRTQHSHILRPLCVHRSRSTNTTHIFMRKMSQDLHNHMLADKCPGQTLQIKTAWLRLLLNAFDGIKYLHTESNGIRHGDIRPANIVLWIDRQGLITDMKVCDFGLSRIGGSRGRVANQLSYCPPEYLESLVEESLAVSEEDRFKGDVWMAGCLLWECIVWLQDGMGDDTSAGLKAFRVRCRHRPHPDTGDCSNQRFFITDLRKDDSGWQSTWDPSKLDGWTRTANADHPVVIRLSPELQNYVDEVYVRGSDDYRPDWQAKRLIDDVLAMLKDVALVPDPHKRGTMEIFCERLKHILDHAFDPQKQDFAT